MSPEEPNPKPRPGTVVFPLGEPGNSPPFVVAEDESKRPRRKVGNRKAKRKAARRARKENRAA